MDHLGSPWVTFFIFSIHLPHARPDHPPELPSAPVSSPQTHRVVVAWSLIFVSCHIRSLPFTLFNLIIQNSVYHADMKGQVWKKKKKGQVWPLSTMCNPLVILIAFLGVKMMMMMILKELLVGRKGVGMERWEIYSSRLACGCSQPCSSTVS